MAKNNISGDHRIAGMEDLLRKMCTKKGYDFDTAFKGLLDYLLWLFDPDGNKPDAWRFDADDAKMFWEMSREYFTMMDAELKKGTEWYDAFGDLYMALHPGGGGKAQFFTPPSLCQITAECCMGGMDISEAHGQRTPFGQRICINDPASGSSRLLLAGAAIFKRLQRDQLGYDDVQQTARRPYLIAEDLDFNCVKMSAINMAVHGCFGEAVCHDSLCDPEGVMLGYIVNETMWRFPTNIPSIRKYTDPMRFVCTTSMMRRRRAQEQKEQSQECVSDCCKATPDSHSDTVQPKGMETSPIVTSEKVKKSQPQQLTLW